MPEVSPADSYEILINYQRNWNKYKSETDGSIDLSGKCFNGIIFKMLDFNFVNFSNSDFISCRFLKCEISNATFESSTFNDTSFEGISISDSIFTKSAMLRVKFQNCNFYSLLFNEVNFNDSKIEHGEIQGADFSNTCFEESTINNYRISCSSFKNSSFINGELSVNEWIDIEVNRKTNLIGTKTNNGPTVQQDGTETITQNWLEKTVSWPTFRGIGRIPLFSFSWAGLVILITYINMIDWINSTKFIQTINYPISIPYAMYFALLSTVLLAIGTLIYSTKCPDRVKEYSETEWVESLQRHRLIYITDGYKNFTWSAASFLFLTTGGAIGLGLMAVKIFTAIGLL